jgi:exoribonuclease R
MLKYHVAVDDADLSAGIDAIRAEFDIPESHSADALAEAERSVERGPVLPPDASSDWVDATDIEFVAVDPAGARDLDQAFSAERHGDGYRIHYAIADVAAFVAPGGSIEADSLERGVTLYAPDGRASLHPDILNEHAASLLPNEHRPSVLWTIDLDGEGRIANAEVTRAMVRVTEALSYRSAQAEIDGPDPRECLKLLAEIGDRRIARERERGAVSLALPSQEIHRDEHGHAQLIFDDTLPVEHWNAQISLVTGIAASHMMLDAGVGLLRTLPAADDEIIQGLRRTARHLAVDWPESETYAERVRSLDVTRPNEAALLMRSARGLRGAGYVAFTSHDEIPADPGHYAIAETYSHVTAPLRRVCDRYANEILLSLSSGTPPPAWATDMLGQLPSVMGKTRQRERAFERAIVDFVETLILAPNIGAEFDAVVVNHRRDAAVIQLRDPAVVSTLTPKRPLGELLRVRLNSVDLSTRTAVFERVQ